MRLTRLKINHFRNLTDVGVELHPSINLFYGANGSGKTSFLETLHFLSTGRSFRGTRLDPIKQIDAEFTLVSADLESLQEGVVTLGLRRDDKGERQIRINGQNELRQSELSRHLPVLVLGPDTVDLLKGTPDERRKFLNQGMFHVEQSFYDLWRQGMRALQQRNNLLRAEAAPNEIDSWTVQFAEASEKIHAMRLSYFERLLPVFTETYRFLLNLDGVKCSYRRGWDQQYSLEDVFASQLSTDRDRGFTFSGFQRADLRFTIEGKPVSEICSRGELKLIAWAAILAQGSLLGRKEYSMPIYLVDDLTAELDRGHQQSIAQLLSKSGGQVLVTGTDPDRLQALWDNASLKLFHVKQGSISEVEKNG